MSAGRNIFRDEAKRAYKEQTKGVAKRNRIPFAKFYKEYKKLKASQVAPQNNAIDEEFDFNKVVNVNNNVELNEVINDQK